MHNVLALIPARGGSKGLTRKNVRLLQGHPLISYSIAAGKQARLVTRTICTTDDPEIAEVAQYYGAEVPFLRPTELAGDLTLDLPVFQHTLHWLAEHEDWVPEIVIQLRPTSPVRFPNQVDKAVQMLLDDPEASGVRTVCPTPCNPYKMWQISKNIGVQSHYMSNLIDVPGIVEPYNQPRQNLPEVFWQTGTIDVARASVILNGSMTGSNLLPLLMDARFAVDIDGEIGLRVADVVMDGLDCIRPDFATDWSRIRLLALDVDGTLTPGTMYYSLEGEALKRFHTHDGHGIAMVRGIGVHVAIITSENTSIAPIRARKLGITEIHIGVHDKLSVLRNICNRLGIGLNEVAYVGDDLSDLDVMKAIGLAGGIPCAVANARQEIRAVAQFKCALDGGFGAVRDVCDKIVAACR